MKDVNEIPLLLRYALFEIPRQDISRTQRPEQLHTALEVHHLVATQQARGVPTEVG